jgi:uncharacterized protein (TIGR02246 family)
MGAAEDRETIQRVIRQINDAWTSGNPDEVAGSFHPSMVMVHPGDAPRVVGRDACVKSYVDYCENAETRRFDAEESQVDLYGDTAVTTTTFEIDYAIGSDVYSEKGQDILVFQKHDGAWLVIWRTMHFEPRCDE